MFGTYSNYVYAAILIAVGFFTRFTWVKWIGFVWLAAILWANFTTSGKAFMTNSPTGALAGGAVTTGAG